MKHKSTVRYHETSQSSSGVTSPKVIVGGKIASGFVRTRGDPLDIVMNYAGETAIGRIDQVMAPPGPASSLSPFDGAFWYSPGNYGDDNIRRIVAQAQNTVWEELMEKLKGDSATLAVTAAETRESFGMITDRARKIGKSLRAARKGNMVAAAKALGVKPKKTHNNRIGNWADQGSSAWLEYHFGWSPLIQDIHSAAMVLTRPTYSRVKLRAGRHWTAPNAARTFGSGQTRRTLEERNFRGIAYQGATFRVSNPNLALQNRLGALNPISVAWEVVPFSFVADWFLGIGAVIDSWTDLCGFEVLNPYSGFTVRGLRTSTGPGAVPCRVISAYFRQVRSIGLTKPSVKRPTGFLPVVNSSWQRAVTALSLVQLLTGVAGSYR